MSMQRVRLETRDASLVAETELPTFANGEPDALVYGDRVFIRKPMQQTQPPAKNSPETYVEAFTMAFAALPAPAQKFDKVTEAPVSIRKNRPGDDEEEDADVPVMRKRI